MVKLLLLTLVPIGLLAQATDYVAELDNDLTTTARKLTLQMAAAPTRNVFPVAAKVYCANACVVTQVINGTAASATSATIRNPRGIRTANATAWTQSNVGAGTTIATDVIPAGTTMRFDLSTYEMRGTSSATNLTLATDAISGRVIMTIIWNERDK